MDVTRRCDYACRILRVAHQREGAYVSVTEIAELEDIPYAFARSIQHDLVQAGLLKTVRGARGGLALACDPYKTTMLQVLEALDGPVSVATCVSDPQYCSAKKGTCAFHSLWKGADALLTGYFGSITLGHVLDNGGESPVVQQALNTTFNAEGCVEVA